MNSSLKNTFYTYIFLIINIFNFVDLIQLLLFPIFYYIYIHFLILFQIYIGLKYFRCLQHLSIEQQKALGLEMNILHMCHGSDRNLSYKTCDRTCTCYGFGLYIDVESVWSLSRVQKNKLLHALNGNTSKSRSISYEDVYGTIDDDFWSSVQLNEPTDTFNKCFGNITKARSNLTYPNLPFAEDFSHPEDLFEKICMKFPKMQAYSLEECIQHMLHFTQLMVDNGWFDVRTSRFEKGIENAVAVYIATGRVPGPTLACGNQNVFEYITKNTNGDVFFRKTCMRFYFSLVGELHVQVKKHPRFRGIIAAICTHFTGCSGQGQMFGGVARWFREKYVSTISDDELKGYWAKLFGSFKDYLKDVIPDEYVKWLKLIGGIVMGALIIFVVREVFGATVAIVDLVTSMIFKGSTSMHQVDISQGQVYGQNSALSALMSVLCIAGFGFASDFSKPNAVGSLFRNVSGTASVLTNIAANLEDCIRYLVAGFTGDETWKKSMFTQDIQEHLNEIEDLKTIVGLESRLRNCNVVRDRVKTLYNWQVLHKQSLASVCHLHRESSSVLMIAMRLVSTWYDIVVQATMGQGLRVQPLCVMLSGITNQGKTLIIELIAHALHKVATDLGRVQDDHHVTFSKAKTTGYWDGYSKNFAYVDDEWLCSGDVTKRDEELVSFLQIVSTGVAPLNYAKLESKGISDFDSQVCIFATNFKSWDRLQNTSPSAIFKRINYPLDVLREGDAKEDFSTAWSFTLSEHARLHPDLYVDVNPKLLKKLGCVKTNGIWTSGVVKRINTKQLLLFMKEDFTNRTTADRIVTAERVHAWLDSLESDPDGKGKDKDPVEDFTVFDERASDSLMMKLDNAEGQMHRGKTDDERAFDRKTQFDWLDARNRQPNSVPVPNLKHGPTQDVLKLCDLKYECELDEFLWLKGTILEHSFLEHHSEYVERVYCFIRSLYSVGAPYDLMDINIKAMMRSQDPTHFERVCPKQWACFNKRYPLHYDLSVFVNWFEDNDNLLRHPMNYGGAFTSYYDINIPVHPKWASMWFQETETVYTIDESESRHLYEEARIAADNEWYGAKHLFVSFIRQVRIRIAKLGSWFGHIDISEYTIPMIDAGTSVAIALVPIGIWYLISMGIIFIAKYMVGLVITMLKKWYYCITGYVPEEVDEDDYDPVEGQGSDVRREQHAIRKKKEERKQLNKKTPGVVVSESKGQTSGRVQRINSCQMKAMKVMRGIQVVFENQVVRFGKCVAIGQYLICQSHMFWRDGEIHKIRLLPSADDYLTMEQGGVVEIKRSQMTIRDCINETNVPSRDLFIIHVRNGTLAQQPNKVVVSRDEWGAQADLGVVRVYPKGPYHPSTVSVLATGCRPINKAFGIWVEGENGTKIARKHTGGYLASNIEGVAGDCSDPYFSLDGKLLGVHVSSISGNSIFMPLYLEDFPSTIGTQQLSYVPETTSFGQGMPYGARYLGTCDRDLTGKAKNAYTPTLYAGTGIDVGDTTHKPVFPMKRVPAPLDGLDGLSPWSKQDTNYGKTSSGDYPDKFMALVRDNPQYLLEGFITVEPPMARRFSEAEAINGIPGSVKSLDLSTSAGMLGKVTGIKRRDMFEGEEGELSAISPLRDALDEIQSMVDTNTVPMMSCLEMHKTELLAPGKLPRTFSACSPEFVVWTKQVCGDAVRLMKEHLPDCVSAVGVNPHGCEWQLLDETVVHAFGEDTELAMGDLSNCDLSVAPIFAVFLFLVFQIFYRYVPGSREYRELYICCMCIVSQIRARGRRLFELDRGHASGHYLTGLFNIVCIFVVHRYAYICEVNLDDYPMKQNIAMKFYGDDSLVAIRRDILPYYNMQVIQQYFAAFGMLYTDSDKNSVIQKSFKPSEATFLSRTFVTRENHITYAPLNIDAIYGMVMFVRVEKGVSVETALDLNVRAALMEAHQHGRVFFNEFKKTLWLEGKARGYVAPALLKYDFDWFENWKIDSYFGSTQISSLGLSVDQMTDYFWD